MLYAFVSLDIFAERTDCTAYGFCINQGLGGATLVHPKHQTCWSNLARYPLQRVRNHKTGGDLFGYVTSDIFKRNKD